MRDIFVIFMLFVLPVLSFCVGRFSNKCEAKEEKDSPLTETVEEREIDEFSIREVYSLEKLLPPKMFQSLIFCSRALYDEISRGCDDPNEMQERIRMRRSLAKYFNDHYDFQRFADVKRASIIYGPDSDEVKAALGMMIKKNTTSLPEAHLSKPLKNAIEIIEEIGRLSESRQEKFIPRIDKMINELRKDVVEQVDIEKDIDEAVINAKLREQGA